MRTNTASPRDALRTPHEGFGKTGTTMLNAPLVGSAARRYRRRRSFTATVATAQATSIQTHHAAHHPANPGGLSSELRRAPSFHPSCTFLAAIGGGDYTECNLESYMTWFRHM